MHLPSANADLAWQPCQGNDLLISCCHTLPSDGLIDMPEAFDIPGGFAADTSTLTVLTAEFERHSRWLAQHSGYLADWNQLASMQQDVKAAQCSDNLASLLNSSAAFHDARSKVAERHRKDNGSLAEHISCP